MIEVPSKEKKGLIVTPDIGVIGETINIPPFKTCLITVPNETIQNAVDGRLLNPREYPLSVSESAIPWTVLIRKYLVPSLRSRNERAGLNMDKMRIDQNGDMQILLANHGPGDILFNPEKLFRFYGYTDERLTQFMRAFNGLGKAVFEQHERSYPIWAEDFLDSNPELRKYLFKEERKGIYPLIWSVKVGFYNTIAFVLPISDSYVINPGAKVDLASAEGLSPNQALNPHKYKVTKETLMDISGSYNEETVQVISNSPEVLMPESLCGIVLAVGNNIDLLKQPFHTAGISFDPSIFPWPIDLPHGDSNFVDPKFHSSIATEHLLRITPDTTLPKNIVLFIMPTNI